MKFSSLLNARSVCLCGKECAPLWQLRCNAHSYMDSYMDAHSSYMDAHSQLPQRRTASVAAVRVAPQLCALHRRTRFAGFRTP